MFLGSLSDDTIRVSIPMTQIPYAPAHGQNGQVKYRSKRSQKNAFHVSSQEVAKGIWDVAILMTA